MIARISASAVLGIEAVPVSVEVDVSPGLPGLTIVGLPDTTVRESRERVRTAIRNSGFPFPADRITVSLAPTDVRKVGAAFDLPIALGILAAGGVLPHHESRPVTIVGGVSLDGTIPPMRGLLPMAVAARRAGHALIFPSANVPEASVVDGLPLFPVATLFDAARVLSAAAPVPAAPTRASPPPPAASVDDLEDVHGQRLGRRAIEVAAAGGHHLLFCGPPGSGKTMLARRLPGLLPPLALDEALTVTAIHSVAGVLDVGAGLIERRPFRAPHHTCSDIALVGGGSSPRPGELSLAHAGVLFLDELPEFGRRVLETLRQPLEQGVVHIARASRSVTFPAAVMLVGAMNPCPCGYFGTGQRVCRCDAGAIERYQRRLSGPLRDRFDLSVLLAPVPFREIRGRTRGESTATVRTRVLAARDRQLVRQGCLNGRLDTRGLKTHAPLQAAECERLLGRAVDEFHLSVRGAGRVVRVARTVADLAGHQDIESGDVAEALHFRQTGEGA